MQNKGKEYIGVKNFENEKNEKSFTVLLNEAKNRQFITGVRLTAKCE